MTQKKLLLKLYQKNKNAVFIGSLGTISNDFEELGIGISIRGAMGCVMGIGLGYALNTKRKVIVVVGEGSFLMKLGSIATINKYKPKNLKIIILNNGKYASCGGQKNNYENLPANFRKNFNKGAYRMYRVAS